MTTDLELNIKLERIHKLLAEKELDALFIGQTGNFAWATCGADSHINTADSNGIASLLITPSRRIVLTNNIESERLADEEDLKDRGWEFLVTPWFSREDQLSGIIQGLKLGSDGSLPNAMDLSAEIASLRSQLTAEEGHRYKILGEQCALGMQQAIQTVKPGMSEFEIAGALSQSVESRGVQGIVILVAVDDRIFSRRHPLPTSKKLDKYAMLVLCGRKWGLICSLTRLIHFGRLPDELREKGQAVAQIDAEMIAATRPGGTIGDVFRIAQSAYASNGFPDEWRLHHQGGSAGYAPREVIATPESDQAILPGQVFAWNPSITGVKSEDTILIGESTNEILTEMTGWPTLDIKIDGKTIKRPAVLEK